MKYFLILTLLALVQGCTLGPLNVTHDKGNLPKISMDTGYDACKLKFKYRDEVNYVCNWDVTL